MKSSIPLMLLAGLLFTGCASKEPGFSSVPGPSQSPQNNTAKSASQQAAPTQPEQSTPSPAIVTPDNSLAGKVVAYNSVGRFVVLNFPVGKMAKIGQTLFIYHNGLKSGQVKVSGPQNGNNIVADLVNGEAQTGDEVRDQ